MESRSEKSAERRIPNRFNKSLIAVTYTLLRYRNDGTFRW